jgi:hypothetical protein
VETSALRDRLTDALRYWEPRRIIYNLILGAIVAFYFFKAYPASKSQVTLNGCLGVFLLAVLANICYCAAYVPDVVAQSSGFAETWRKYRWIVLLTGILFAGIVTRFVALGMFNIPVA